jgi:hypothetical protein
MIKDKKTERFCGNCESHNLYEFPSRMLCSTRHGQGKDPIVDTLWCCEDWNPVSQECYCVREAQRRKEESLKQR